MALFPLTLFAGQKWPVIDKAELAETKPQIDPDAGAEILLREVTLDHSSVEGSEDTYYIRAKIYSKPGIEEFSKVELPYDADKQIRYIAARTIKPDGTVVELNPKEIFNRVVIKTGNIKTNVKSFALPALEPGCVVEYTYTEITDGPGAYMPMYFQTPLPARKVHYKVKLIQLPYDVAVRFVVRTMSFNCAQQPLDSDKDGWYHFQMTNLAAAKDEPFQPPAINTLSTTLLYYELQEDSAPPDKYWGNIAKKLEKELDETAKPAKAVQTALATIIASGDDELTKLKKIYNFCQTKIINRYSDASGLTDKQREKLKENKNAADVLKNGSGDHKDINRLFAALCRAAGFETHYAACNDRSSIFFSNSLTEVDYVLSDRVVAVRTGGKLQFFDPGSTYLPFALLNWWNADTTLLVGDKTGKSRPDNTPSFGAESSQTQRIGQFKLADDGTLEGEVSIRYGGYEEIRLKRILDGKTPAQRETYLREDLQEYQKSAELTAIKIENTTSPTEPLKIAYHLRIPQYADSTGSRLFLQPAVFQKGLPAWFEAKTRRTSIIFHYRNTETDVMSIQLPDGFKLEEASAPGGLDLSGLGEYATSIRFSRKSNTITYNRKFVLSGIAFSNKNYGAIKSAFELVRQTDSHTLTLKAVESPSAPEASPPDSTKSNVTAPAGISAEPSNKP